MKCNFIVFVHIKTCIERIFLQIAELILFLVYF